MKILVTAPYTKEGLIELEQQFGEVAYRCWKENGRAYRERELMKLLEETSADALITEHDEVTETVINRFPELKFIGVCRGTPSNVSVEAASANGIPVFYTPARNAQAVAEMFIANLITFMRHTIAGIEWLKSGQWSNGAHTSYLQFKGNELAGKTIGMVGFGAIGNRIAEMVRSFPCKIVYYDPYFDSPDPEHVKLSLEELFEASDIVSVHLPVNETTRNMIDGNLISRMKPDAIFVNTARAVVVDRTSLLDALEKNKIRGAILDVFYSEPPDELDNRIIHLPNVLATPHIAGATFEVEDHHVRIMNEALDNWFVKSDTGTRFLVNRETLVI